MLKKVTSIIIILAIALTGAIMLTACNKGYDIPDDLTINVEIYEGDTLLGTITKDTLAKVKQEKITMTTTNSKGTESTSTYIAYSVINAAKKANINLPTNITSVKSYASDNYKDVYEITSLDKAYISIGFEDDGKFAADEKGPRFISDKTSGSSNSVAKLIGKIVINPIEAETPGDNDNDNDNDDGDDTEKEEVLAYTLTPVWSEDGRTLTVTFKDHSSNKTNIISLYTPEEGALVTQIKIDDNDYKDLESLLFKTYQHVGKNDTVTNYYGYKLDDIIKYMGKYSKSGSWIEFVEDFTAVRFACTDDEAEKDYSARAYTKAEVENEIGIFVVSDKGTTRIFSAFSDNNDPKTYRNNLKSVSEIQIYALSK